MIVPVILLFIKKFTVCLSKLLGHFVDLIMVARPKYYCCNNSVAGSLKLFCAGQILRNTLLCLISSNITSGSLEESAFTQNSSQMFSLVVRLRQVEGLQASNRRKNSTTWWCWFSLRISCACLRSLGEAIRSIIHALQSLEPRSGASSRSTKLSEDNTGTNISRALNFSQFTIPHP